MDIKEIRKLTGLSAQKFGDKYDIPLRTIQNWEGGVNTPPPYLVKLLERVVKEDIKEPSGDLISREETLTAFADYVGGGMSMNDYEALSNIVEKMPPVKQEPCEDAISRQAVLDLAVKIELPDSQTFFCISPEDVETLPSVIPQQKA